MLKIKNLHLLDFLKIKNCEKSKREERYVKFIRFLNNK